MKLPLVAEEDARFQMAPMIDVVFLLLVFFMCASHLSSSKNIPLEMPLASKGAIPRERTDRWVVNIDHEGGLFSGMQAVALEDLSTMVEAAAKANPQLKIYLRADQRTPHREVRKVMEAMAAKGMDEFIFGVYTPPQSRTEEAP
jgi:biopolymer transport protein ExbD